MLGLPRALAGANTFRSVARLSGRGHFLQASRDLRRGAPPQVGVPSILEKARNQTLNPKPETLSPDNLFQLLQGVFWGIQRGISTTFIFRVMKNNDHGPLKQTSRPAGRTRFQWDLAGVGDLATKSTPPAGNRTLGWARRAHRKRRQFRIPGPWIALSSFIYLLLSGPQRGDYSCLQKGHVFLAPGPQNAVIERHRIIHDLFLSATLVLLFKRLFVRLNKSNIYMCVI